MRLEIHWAIRDFFPVSVIREGTNGRVIVMGGLSENLRLLHLVRSTDHLICLTYGDYLQAEYSTMRQVVELFGLDVERVSVLCNYPAQVDMAQSAGMKAYFCNHNALINEHVMRPRILQKQFDAVCNARPWKAKRVRLARKVERLALIQGPYVTGTEAEDLSDVPYAYRNNGKLSLAGVAQVLSASYVGLALSAAEGACLASSEYLLCGLPVVTTPSRGGRDIWYDAQNSIVCEPNADAVREAVDHTIARLKRGEIDPREIRRRHIEQARDHRSRFLQVLNQAFEHVECADNPEKVFEQTLAARGILPQYVPYVSVSRSLEHSTR